MGVGWWRRGRGEGGGGGLTLAHMGEEKRVVTLSALEMINNSLTDETNIRPCVVCCLYDM